MTWKPHDKQELFLERGEFEVLMGGAAGPGKTDALIADCGRGIEHPSYHGLLLRRTYPQLQEVIDRSHEFYKPLGGVYKSSLHRWEWPNGARITMGHMQHEKDKFNYHGREFHYCGWDELTQFLQSQYLFVMSRIRRSKKGLPLLFRATTNPGGVGHIWVKKRFIDIANPYETYIDPKTHTSRVFIPATVYDNPSIMDNDPEYIYRLEALPNIEKLRLLHGVWDVFEGQKFTELNDIKHRCDEVEIPAEWPRYMVFDWGYAKPWCALWFTVDFNGVIYLYREYYGMAQSQDSAILNDVGSRETNDQICQKIVDIENYEKITQRFADPACWSPTKLKGSNTVHGPSFTEDAMGFRLYFSKPDNDRIRGIQQCHLRFQMDEVEKKDDSGELITVEENRFFAMRSCPIWWEEMTNLRDDEKNPEDVDTRQFDHGYDNTRYFFLSRPIAPKKKFKLPPGSFMAERQKMITAKKYAMRHGCSIAQAYGKVR